MRTKQVKLLVAICSCQGHEAQRECIRKTWLNRVPEGIEYIFFMGGGAETAESDVLVLEVDDGYQGLPLKVQKLFQAALVHYDFDYLFKCDDDTYVALERLIDLVDHQVDVVGNENLKDGYPYGGAGYLLSRKFVQMLSELPQPGYGAEDMWVGQMALSLCQSTKISARLQAGCNVFPRQENDLITAHHCPIAMLEVIHDFYERLDRNRHQTLHFSAKQQGWRGSMELLPNGVFLCGDEKPHGQWEFQKNGEILFLNWFHRGLDTLYRKQRGFASASFELIDEHNDMRGVTQSLWSKPPLECHRQSH